MGVEKKPYSDSETFSVELDEQKTHFAIQEPFTDIAPIPEDDSGQHTELHGLLGEDVEAQRSVKKASKAYADTAPEHTVPTRAKLMALGLYFLCNVGLTLYNKTVLGSFPYPWLLTALHTGFASIGCYVMTLFGYFKLSSLNRRENLTLIAFSFLFTINIAISNVSLAMVSIPFHQVLRSTCPLVTTLIYRVFFSRAYSTATYVSLMPVVLGVSMATFGDFSYTTLGFMLTFLGVILAAVKTVAANRIMTSSLDLPPLEFLIRMSPLAFVQSLLYGVVSGEVSALLSKADNMPDSSKTDVAWAALPTVLVLLGNGLLAFVLNVSSFRTNKLAGALAMTVCANFKQCITIVLGVLLFNVHVGLLNAAGLLVTTIGAAYFSYVELISKGKLKKAAGGTATGGS